MALTIFVVVILAVVAVLFIGAYNGLIDLKNQLERSWANIDVILKQRYDEIGQLVQVVEQFTQYESDVIQRVVEARRSYGSARTVDEKMEATKNFDVAIKGLLAIAENYPELRSSENFQHLQGRVSKLEEQIADRRETYNEFVAIFNARIEQIPHVLIASLLGYGPKTHFEVAEQERQMPSLKMNLPKRAS